MNAIALKEYNKRASVQLNSEEVTLIEGMKSFSPAKISEAFSMLVGRKIPLKDVELLILIIDLTAALTPPMQIVRTGGEGSPFNWPSAPYRSTFGGGDVMCGGSSLLS